MDNWQKLLKDVAKLSKSSRTFKELNAENQTPSSVDGTSNCISDKPKHGNNGAQKVFRIPLERSQDVLTAIHELRYRVTVTEKEPTDIHSQFVWEITKNTASCRVTWYKSHTLLLQGSTECKLFNKIVHILSKLQGRG